MAKVYGFYHKNKLITSWSQVPVVMDLPMVCVILDVSPEQGRRLCAKGDIKAVKVGGVWRINKCDLMDYLKVDKDSIG
ncbi:MAG: helix-turn-helix domain-containing protein [Ruminiclostridium sp.]|uniref:helix-turn-helix domain-containing protein n=1 Tax=Ruminococcus sp. TaxID=41978 RepID=UPI0025F424B2|nr:helix-turn-helix domain-containing protein [Ruminococcus sp.]MBR1433044.1 helix-turn-helix domain-containing protein [Ruminococcus sp.]MBR1831050.1 helix-turn-helix domain-containing protein [Ruminiclostridium sp.]